MMRNLFGANDPAEVDVEWVSRDLAYREAVDLRWAVDLWRR